MMDPHSEQAASIARLTNYFFIAAAFIFLLVTTLTIVFIIKYRAKPGDKMPKPIYNNRRLEFFIVGVPLAMVSFFFYLTIKTMREVLPSAEGKDPDVVIIGHQWWWEAFYPAAGVHTANEIHLPVGKKLLIRLLSADVIHDWWVPQLGNKMDVVPGRQNHLWLTIRNPGYYEGVCSEFCGRQHANMHIRVYAQEEADFQTWLAQNGEKAKQPDKEPAQQGALIFQEKTCGSCHRIEGTAAAGTTGPDLSHLASRHTLLTGVLDNTPENLNRFLKDPQKVKPGVNMPNFWLDDSTRAALVAYLKQLK